MAEMSKWERIQATIQQEPTDRIPWSLWRHFYERETSAAELARVMLDWQQRHDFDWLKVNPRAQYHAEVWGCRYRYSGQPTVKPVLEQAAVKTPGDWRRIEPQPPTTPPLEEQLQALSTIGRGLRGSVPFVETVFCPLGVAGYLIGDEQQLRRHLREHPDEVHRALQAIADTLVAFVHELLNAGASGIFLATTAWATTDMLTEQEYDTFGRRYDLQVLAAASEARLNVLHVCRKHNMLRHLLDYPVHILNWAASEEGNPSLGEIADAVKGRAVASGLSNAALTAPDEEQALREAAEAADQARNRGLILTGNCSIPVTSSPHVIDAVHRWILQQ
ncbi:MAG TPA: uroporphyrinogen decarboxylase family protein [Chloroflexota bacterium]|jgi:uroporphyrinogen decarboxylase|nr:uroporphyrinogen decarboxylase family protein [Chloroflexota bacterium]